MKKVNNPCYNYKIYLIVTSANLINEHLFSFSYNEHLFSFSYWLRSIYFLSLIIHYNSKKWEIIDTTRGVLPRSSRNIPGSDTNRRITQYCSLLGFPTLKVLSLVWTYRFLGPALNGFTIPRTRPPCVKPMTLKSFEFYTWVPLSNDVTYDFMNNEGITFQYDRVLIEFNCQMS